MWRRGQGVKLRPAGRRRMTRLSLHFHSDHFTFNLNQACGLSPQPPVSGRVVGPEPKGAGPRPPPFPSGCAKRSPPLAPLLAPTLREGIGVLEPRTGHTGVDQLRGPNSPASSISPPLGGRRKGRSWADRPSRPQPCALKRFCTSSQRTALPLSNSSFAIGLAAFPDVQFPEPLPEREALPPPWAQRTSLL